MLVNLIGHTTLRFIINSPMRHRVGVDDFIVDKKNRKQRRQVRTTVGEQRQAAAAPLYPWLRVQNCDLEEKFGYLT